MTDPDPSEGGGGVGDPPPPPVPVQLNLKYHCLFCLQPQSIQTVLGIVQKNPQNLKDFQPILHYLTGTDPSHDKSKVECEEKGIPVMGGGGNLPPMCHQCYGILAELGRLHQQLLDVQWRIQKKTEEARGILTRDLDLDDKNRSAPRRQTFFKRIRSSGMAVEEVEAVTKFVEGLHDKIIAEATGSRTVIFPSRPPPDFVPSPASLLPIPFVKLIDYRRRRPNKSKSQSVSKRSKAAMVPAPPILSVGIDTEPVKIEDELLSQDEDDGDPLRDHLEVEGLHQLDSDPIQPSSPEPGSEGEDKYIPSSSSAESSETESDSDPPTPPPPKRPRPRRRRNKVKGVDGRRTVKMEDGRRKALTSSSATLIRARLRTPTPDKEVSSSSAPKKLRCTVPSCDSRFRLMQSLKLHLRRVHDLRSTRSYLQDCPECKVSLTIGTVPEHLKKAHGMEQVISCRQCPHVFTTWEGLLVHQYDHRKPSAFTSKEIGVDGLFCQMCDGDATGKIQFQRYETLCHHYFSVHKIGRKLVCDDCAQDFYAQQTLTSHRRNMHSGAVEIPKTKKIHKCDICPGEVSFHKSDGLLAHKIKMHGAPVPPCRFCPETFQAVYTLRRHERTVHMGLVREYKCKFESCGMTFQSWSMWKHHELAVHNPKSGPKLFVCDSCGKGYNYKFSLEDHINRIHLGKKRELKHICEVCGEGFISPSILQEHKWIHTGERPHTCHVCGRTFRQRTGLNTHVKGHQAKGEAVITPSRRGRPSRKRVEEKANDVEQKPVNKVV